MKKEDLMKIRSAGGVEFTDLKEYGAMLNDILGDIEAVPVVVGVPHWKAEEMELFTLPPKTNLDRMNVLAYKAGLDQLMQTNGFSTKDFKASLELGVESRSRIHEGDAIFSTGFDLEGISYHLDIHWEENDNRKGIYLARKRAFVPRSYQVMRKFIGPQFEDY